MKADALLKHNIDALLKARGQTRHELAAWVRQSVDRKKVDPWISGIFTRPNREFQFKYLDRIADFFGLAVYQLFQPGISPLLERRKGADRRKGTDRRVSGRQSDRPTTAVRQLALTPDDEAMLAELRALSYEQYQHVRGWIAVARYGRNTAPNTTGTAGPPAGGVGALPSTPPPHRGRRHVPVADASTPPGINEGSRTVASRSCLRKRKAAVRR